MAIRQMQLPNPVRTTQAAGNSLLRFRPGLVLGQFNVTFSGQVLDLVGKGRRVNDVSRVLETCGLQDWLGSIADSFHRSHGVPELEWTVTRLLELADLTDDYSQPDGRWRQRLGDLDSTLQEVLREAEGRIRHVAREAIQRHGRLAAIEALQHVRDALSAARDHFSRGDVQLTATDTVILRDCAKRLRQAARPASWFWRVLTVFFAQLPPKLWLTNARQASIKRRDYPEIIRAAELRSAIEGAKRLGDLFERILGRPGTAGVIDGVLDQLKTEEEFFARIAAAVKQLSPVIPSTNEIPLVHSIDDVIDPRRGIRLVDVCFDIAARAGCTPQRCADWIRIHGVEIGHVKHRPDAWPQLDIAMLSRAVVQAVGAYLGYEGKASLNMKAPRTAAEHILGLNLASDVFRALLAYRLPDLARRSYPYAEFESLRDAAPQTRAFLYCHPKDRKLFEGLLLVHAKIVNRSSGDSATSRQYQLGSRCVLMLAQYAIAAAGGAQRDLQQAFLQRARLRNANIRPLFDDQSEQPEVRLLASRPDEYEDAKRLVTLAIRARIVIPIGVESDRYNLAKPEPGLRTLFAPDRLEAEWAPPESFQQHLKTGAFVDFVQATFPELTDWLDVVQRLRAEAEAATVVQGLAGRQILEANPHGLYRMSRLPSTVHTRAPYGLFRRLPGIVVGLTEDELVTQLLRNDWLYNAIFWQAADAIAEQRVSPTDAPRFLVDYIRSLDGTS